MTETNRVNFGTLKEVITPPYFIESQIGSFREFLQENVDVKDRRNIGLESVFRDAFPIASYDGTVSLDYVSYRIAPAKYSEYFCLKEGITFGAPLYVTLRLTNADGARDEEIYIGEIPLMSKRGSFIISGAERVVVSQLHRSPGICFEVTQHTSGKNLYAFRIMPDRGTWIEVQSDQNDLLYVYLDRRHRRRRRKFLISTLLRAFGYSSDHDILSLFYEVEESSVDDLLKRDSLIDFVLTDDIIDLQRGVVVARAYDNIGKTLLKSFQEAGIAKVSYADTSFDNGLIIRSLRKDTSRNEEEALFEVYKLLRPGEPVNLQNARAFWARTFTDNRRYDLSQVGRYKLNKKLGLSKDLDDRVVGADDIVAATKYLCSLRNGRGIIDDIDNLGSRRVRGVGELLVNQCRIGLARMERVIRERMSLFDQSVDMLTPQKLLNPKLLMAVIRDFFARSQLSQFMDQINPLSEVTHKRRLSALGPNGLNREHTGLEVRDVHPSHYGRICPIETSEGPNIGLINSLSTYARINKFGFIETPYRIVRDGRVTDEVVYLSADDEEGKVIAQANSEMDAEGRLLGKVAVRKSDQLLDVPPSEVDYMDVSPKQVISIAAGLIPFLEHDDTSRALMGANMQRQGVPLLLSEAPLVGTGIEKKIAYDSGHVVIAQRDGVVASVDGNRIAISSDGTLPVNFNEAKNKDQNIQIYRLNKYMRSNTATCFNQHPVVSKGQVVKVGDVLADGASTDHGELALGKNVLVAFMPWNGYNFEDAVILSERMISDDVFTSIHIDEYEVTARDTKLGIEEITRDIPNAGDEALKNLNRDGVIKIGAEVKPGDILVGKVTPKTETDLAPEEKLLRAIFGEKAADVKDTSLIAPAGCYGTVMDVKISSRTDHEKEDVSESECRRRIKKANEEFRAQADRIRDDLTEAFSSILLGEKIPLDIVDTETQETILVANRKITKTLLRRLAASGRNIDMPSSPVKNKIFEIIDQFQTKFDDLEEERLHRVAAIESGDLDESGVIKNVKVFIANKRKIQVGDKMAGRHGNKGVVSRIVKREDMPFLPNGRPVDIILNPLGVPSRMNVGQVLETYLGAACKKLGIKVATHVFDDTSEEKIQELMGKADLPLDGKTELFDGCTGQKFDQRVTVGYIYMMKLNHLVADKVHARAVGPYSLITQQPLGGRAQYGGQRFGEMEVWAMEAYGAAYTLQELLTVKSDDSQGRTKIYESIVKGDTSLDSGIPQSFNVLMKELQGLCLDVRLEDDPALDIDNIGATIR